VRGKLVKLLVLLFIVMHAELSFGQDIKSRPMRADQLVDAPTTSVPANGIPSLTDLMTVIDKATASDNNSKDWSTPIKLVIIFTGLAILPSLLVMMTSFTRIAIVLSFIRRALTTQSIPPTIAMMGLALFLTLYTMAPTLSLILQTRLAFKRQAP
jgi:flagellar biosynthesis protein FliP